MPTISLKKENYVALEAVNESGKMLIIMLTPEEEAVFVAGAGESASAGRRTHPKDLIESIDKETGHRPELEYDSSSG